MFPRRFAFLPLLLVSTVLAQVPPPNPVPTPPVKTTPAFAIDHSQEPFVVEKLRTSYRFENDGTGKRDVYAKIKVQSEAGVEQWG
ncbi:MAG TPA: hypothetical protein VLW06_03390, partial [Terriglobales bacterium]|nr:hypothetical protein [Terriglobales bacterium]